MGAATDAHSVRATVGFLMSGLDSVLAALAAPKLPLKDALPVLPATPGLYAIYGNEAVWQQLRLGTPATDVPLYVGKAEDSLVKRDLATHFGNGRTGSSTLRRSFAALLREELELSAVPRNPAKPSHFSNYGLIPTDDAKLTAWMRNWLQIAVWSTDGSRPLAVIEAEVLRHWIPPLNIAGVDHRWKADLQRRRKVMADQARRWTP